MHTHTLHKHHANVWRHKKKKKGLKECSLARREPNETFVNNNKNSTHKVGGATTHLDSGVVLEEEENHALVDAVQPVVQFVVQSCW